MSPPIFTRFLRELETTDGPPDTVALETLLDALRRALVWKLKQRSLWSASPAYLGVYGHSRWSEPGALDELLIDCYAFIFIDRKRALKAQLEVVATIDGLVSRNISNFLFEVQKRHDPLGFRVFTALKEATLAAVETGAFQILEGGTRIGNATVLGCEPWSSTPTAEDEALREVAQAWNDDLLPELITADGKVRQRTLTRLEGHLKRLPEHGIRKFRFGQLLAPLKADIRDRWSTIWDSASGETVPTPDGEGLLPRIRLTPPDTGLEERDAFSKLLAGVAEAIEQLDEPVRTRTYLKRLWVFLRQYATDSHAPESPAATKGDKLPSRRRIAELLGIPRDRLPGLFATLQGLTRSYQQPTSESSAVRR